MGGPGKAENLKPKTPAKERGRLGGIQSGKAKRAKKLMSEIYAEILADQTGIKKGQGIQKVVEEILNSTSPKGVSARVALLREFREATEGSKIKTESAITINTDDERVQEILKAHGINKPEN